jgi:hypothetical protein
MSSSHAGHNSGQPPACVKVLVREARTLAAPSSAPVWVQGYVVWLRAPLFILDDGSGVALVDATELACVDACALSEHRLTVGTHAMVVGQASVLQAPCAPEARHVQIAPATVRNLSQKKNAPMLDALWNSEVVDAWLDRNSGTGRR